MSYFERIEKLGQMNIYDYLTMESLSVNETLELNSKVRITRQKRFYEVVTPNLHEAARTVEGVLKWLSEDAKYN